MTPTPTPYSASLITEFVIPPIQFCGLTFRASKKRRFKLDDVLYSMCKPKTKKAVIFVEDTEYILWDALTNSSRDLLEHVKRVTYFDHRHVYDNIIKKWYNGNNVQIHWYTKENHEDKFYLCFYVCKFNEKYEVIDANITRVFEYK